MLDDLRRDLEDVRGNAEKIEHGAIGIQQIVCRIIKELEALLRINEGKKEDEIDL